MSFNDFNDELWEECVIKVHCTLLHMGLRSCRPIRVPIMTPLGTRFGRAGLGQKTGPGILAQTLHMIINTTNLFTPLNMYTNPYSLKPLMPC